MTAALLRKLLSVSPGASLGARRAGAGGVAAIDNERETLRGHAAERSRLIDSATEHSSAGRYGEALALVSDSLQRTPDDPDLVFARASILFEWGRLWEARTGLLKAEALGLRTESLFEKLGWTFLSTTGAPSAEPWMRKAVATDENGWAGHFGLGAALRIQGKTTEAIESFERALALSPDNVQCLSNLAECNTARNELRTAETYARRAIAVDGKSPLAWTNLGVALVAQDRFGDAIEAFEQADRLEAASGSESDQYLNLGTCLRDTGRLEESLAFYSEKLRQRPFAGAHAHYAHALLVAGRFPEGWDQYEFRWLQQPLLSRRLPLRKPVWAGQDLRGKTILLRTEQGIGDVIQFIRYAPHVKVLGATVLLHVRLGLGDLPRSFPGVDRVLGPHEPYPEFDYYIHLMSLPRVFGTVVGSVPQCVPYLSVESERGARWANRLDAAEGLRVGLAWAGDASHMRDRYRSISLSAMGPLAAVAGVTFYSLQKGAAAAQVGDPPVGMRLIDLGPDLQDFADTAAAIERLDLVICVDTSVAHLAGALGKPTWVLVPTPADWRWMESREDSPWYPTMRLFRQSRQGEWTDVIGRVKDALDKFTRSKPRESRRTPDSANDALAHQPTLLPIVASCPASTGLSAVAEAAMGIVQYFPDQPMVGDSIAWYGEYLQSQVNLLARLISPGAVVMEVGSGVGAHVLSIAPAVGSAGHLFLYESRPMFQHVLRQNLSANGITNVTVMKRHQSAETIDELRLEALNWLKINEDSDALAVLDGAANSLWLMRPRLFVAAPDEPAVRQIAARIRDFGYQCWRLETPYFNPENFNRREEDVFYGRVAFAVLAIPEEIEFDVAFDGCVKLA